VKREYNVWWTSGEDEVKTGFFVSDITDEEYKLHKKKMEKLRHLDKIAYKDQESVRPRIATFPISELYSEQEQRERARMLCDYLNKIQEAKERAERDTAFVDLLKAGAPVDQK
jgi:hypothetical protein